jgi:hemerythrin-like domain-containing protein
MAATGMAQIHNVMIRGLNSMFHQGSLVTTPTDIKDFTDYCLAFCVLIHGHHSTEEVLTFPLIEAATGIPGVMDQNIIQHEAFLPKLHDFNNYLMQVKLGVREYDAEKFIALLNAFSTLMVQHLTDEVRMFVEMKKYPIDWKPILNRAVKHAVETAEKVNFLGSTCMQAKFFFFFFWFQLTMEFPKIVSRSTVHSV